MAYELVMKFDAEIVEYLKENLRFDELMCLFP